MKSKQRYSGMQDPRDKGDDNRRDDAGQDHRAGDRRYKRGGIPSSRGKIKVRVMANRKYFIEYDSEADAA
jgi:hypothetical protein